METESIQPDDAGLSVDQMAAKIAQRWKEPPPEEPAQVETEVVEALAETEEVEAQAEEQIESVEEVETIDAEDQSEEIRFESLDEIIEATGMDRDDFLKNIKTKIKIQGEEGETTLSDLIKGYQLEKTFTRKNEAFIQERQNWEKQQEAAKAQINEDLRRTGQTFALAQQQLTHEFNAINWEQLQRDDPQQYLLKRQELGERKAMLDQQIAHATAQAQKFAEAQEQERLKKDQEFRQKEYKLLIDAIPEWADKDTREKEGAKVHEYLLTNGYTPEEVESLSDHRVYLMARRAMASENVATKAEIAKKRVTKTPKLIKSNADRVDPKKATVNKLRARLKKTGDLDDVAALLKARSK